MKSGCLKVALKLYSPQQDAHNHGIQRKVFPSTREAQPVLCRPAGTKEKKNVNSSSVVWPAASKNNSSKGEIGMF